MAQTFPATYDTSSCYLVPINASLIPIVAGALGLFQERWAWNTDEDYERGYNAFAELKVCLMKTCIDALIESNNRLYRMLDTAIYGTQYLIQSPEPNLIVVPEIGPTRSLFVEDERSIIGRMETFQQLLDNALNGTETPQYDRANGVRDLLEQLISSIGETGQYDEEMLARLVEIAGLLV